MVQKYSGIISPTQIVDMSRYYRAGDRDDIVPIIFWGNEQAYFDLESSNKEMGLPRRITEIAASTQESFDVEDVCYISAILANKGVELAQKLEQIRPDKTNLDSILNVN